MKNFILNFEDSLSLIYQLNDCPVNDHWISLIQKRNISEVCPNNHLSGITDEKLVQDKINRFYQLIDIINVYSPKKIIKIQITDENWKYAFEKMHIHFPELKNNSNYLEIYGYLTEYNDLIHWLESNFLSQNLYNSMCRITLDFNKSVYEFYDLPDKSYQYCEPFITFGDLVLHYTHVGRHAYEQFIVNDIVCPKDQFVPQRTYNASVRLSFNDLCKIKYQSKDKMLQQWQNFYNLKGGIDFWQYKITDPKIQFGYIKIGSLHQVIKNNENIDNKKQIIDLITNNKIINWIIKGA